MSTPNIDQYTRAVRAHISASRAIARELASIRSFVRSCHEDDKLCKVAGTTSGVWSTLALAGLFFAPFTGGLSIAASGALSTMAAAGAVGSIGASLLSSFASSSNGKKAIERIQKCQEDHKRSVDIRNRDTEAVVQLISSVAQNGELAAAILSTFAFLVDAGKKGMTGWNVYSGTTAILNAIKVGEIQKILAPTGIKITTNMLGTSMQVAFPSAKAIASMTPAQQTAFLAIGKNPEKLLGSSAVVSTFGKVCFLASVFFTVADVASLVMSWDKPHPLVDPINKFIDDLERSIAQDEEALRIIETLQR